MRFLSSGKKRRKITSPTPSVATDAACKQGINAVAHRRNFFDELVIVAYTAIAMARSTTQRRIHTHAGMPPSPRLLPDATECIVALTSCGLLAPWQAALETADAVSEGFPPLSVSATRDATRLSSCVSFHVGTTPEAFASLLRAERERSRMARNSAGSAEAICS